MSKKTSFRILLEDLKFAANSKVAKLLEKNNSTDVALATACVTTKAYKENQRNLKNEADAIISGTIQDEVKAVPTAKQSQDTRPKEPPRGGFKN